jgi:hypothetical protein
MAGGLFGRPFVFNEKCILFSLICMALFIYKPQFQNQYLLYLTLFIIFVVAYVAMAWYDYYFNCDIVPLNRGPVYGPTQLFKPDAHVPDKQEKGKDTPLDAKRRYFLISIMHLALISPLLGYIAVYRKQINPITYPILGVLALFTAGYHGGKILINSH